MSARFVGLEEQGAAFLGVLDVVGPVQPFARLAACGLQPVHAVVDLGQGQANGLGPLAAGQVGVGDGRDRVVHHLEQTCGGAGHHLYRVAIGGHAVGHQRQAIKANGLTRRVAGVWRWQGRRDGGCRQHGRGGGVRCVLHAVGGGRAHHAESDGVVVPGQAGWCQYLAGVAPQAAGVAGASGQGKAAIATRHVHPDGLSIHGAGNTGFGAGLLACQAIEDHAAGALYKGRAGAAQATKQGQAVAVLGVGQRQ